MWKKMWTRIAETDQTQQCDQTIADEAEHFLPVSIGNSGPRAAWCSHASCSVADCWTTKQHESYIRSPLFHPSSYKQEGKQDQMDTKKKTRKCQESVGGLTHLNTAMLYPSFSYIVTPLATASHKLISFTVMYKKHAQEYSLMCDS